MEEYKYVHDERLTYLEPLNKQSLDLFLCFCGIEACKPGYSFGPYVRSQYIIHYVLDGEGYYQVNDKQHHIKKGQGFLITPETVTFYQADEENPWKYMWIGFNGVKAAHYLNYANLNEDNLIFECIDNELEACIMRMFELNANTPSNELELQSLIYLFLSRLAKNTKPTDSKQRHKVAAEGYLEQSIQFINKYYQNIIKVNDIATYVGVNRSYLTSIFKQKLNISPQEFLLNFRLDKACQLLTHTNLPINEIAKSVGYPDPFAFSKIFKKVYGISPKKYRQSIED